MSQIFVLVGQSSLQTLEMVFFSTLFSLVLGFPVGVLLYITNPTGISPRPILNQVLSRIVNVLRSFPFIILMIVLFPTPLCPTKPSRSPRISLKFKLRTIVRLPKDFVSSSVSATIFPLFSPTSIRRLTLPMRSRRAAR